MITLSRVSKQYRQRGKTIRALDDVSIQFGPGFSALVGPNGGGKSTLMGVATTLVTPTSGEIYFNGVPLDRKTRDNYRNSIGYVPQHVSFVRGMTVLDTLHYVGWTSGISNEVSSARANELLGGLGLLEKQKAKTKELSGGQLRRLGIAAALMNKPSVLFLDEPTVGLDPEARLQVRRVIAYLAQSVSVIMSTHLVEDIRYLPGALHVLAQGKLVYSGSWGDLSARVPYVRETDGSSFEMAYGEIIRQVGGM